MRVKVLGAFWRNEPNRRRYKPSAVGNHHWRRFIVSNCYLQWIGQLHRIAQVGGAGTHILAARSQAVRSKEKPRRVWPAGVSAQLVTRPSRNEVAVDTDAKSVVVLVLEGIEGLRLGHASWRGKQHNRVARSRL